MISNQEKMLNQLSARKLSFDERIKLIETTEGVSDFVQPGCILQYFRDLKESEDPFEDALKIANVFKKKLGLIIIEAEGTLCFDRPQTIMDDLLANDECDTFWNYTIYLAFKKTGFLHAEKVEPKKFYELFKANQYGSTSVYKKWIQEWAKTVGIEEDPKMD